MSTKKEHENRKIDTNKRKSDFLKNIMKNIIQATKF